MNWVVRLACLFGLTVFVSSQTTITDKLAKGDKVVEAAAERISAACMFDDDKLLLRRIAYVETLDGTASGTFSPDKGGIWKVDKSKFDVTQTTAFRSYMSDILNDIKSNFSIDWTKVVYSDLNRPLHSALAARMYLHYTTRSVSGEIPRSIAGQADYWYTHYRPGGSKALFTSRSNLINKVSNCVGADMIFVLDSSGSIGSTNWQKELDFAAAVVDNLDIGMDKYRVGVIVYSSTNTYNIPLNAHFTKTALKNAITALGFTSGGTNTHTALDRLVNEGFSAANGGRPKDGANPTPRIAFVLTDGQSSNSAATIAAGQRVKDDDITIYSVGVGSSVRVSELEAIASEPKCLQYFQLNSGFAEIDDLVVSITRSACKAPFALQNDTTVDPDGGKPCTIKVPVQGITVKIRTTSGTAHYYLSSSTYPSQAYYEHKVTAVAGKPAVIYITQAMASLTDNEIFCYIEGSNPVEIETDIGNTDWCSSSPCPAGQTCVDRGTTYQCQNPCSSSPCPPGHRCVSTGSSYRCEASGYDCSTNNPCYYGLTGPFHYQYNGGPNSFVQCSQWGQCFVMPCAPGLVWSVSTHGCDWPSG